MYGMVLLSLGAQLIETVLVRGVIYTAELGGKVIWWAGSGALNYIWPSTGAEKRTPDLEEQIRVLQEKVVVLETNAHRTSKATPSKPAN